VSELSGYTRVGMGIASAARWFGGVLVMIALAAGIRTTRLTAFTQHHESQRYEDAYYLPPSQWLPLMSLGYRSAAADLLWCRTLIYIGEQFIRGGSQRHAQAYADAIITLDPDFKAPYRWPITVMLYREGDFVLKDVLEAADYLRRAVKRWPNDGELAWDLGSTLRFEVVPFIPDAALKKKLESEAADLLSTAALLGAGPPWLALNSSALLTKLGKKEQAIRHLEEVYGTVQDEDTKKQIAAQLAALRSQTYSEAVRAANDQFEGERQRSFPYLSRSAFFVIGPKAQFERLRMLEDDFLPPSVSEQVFDE
jgi:tetratricopeptide (TPR) repeat protein